MACDHVKALKLVEDEKWDQAHKLVQPHSDRISCLIHGYLHRIEGDLSNAKYWYRRAEEEMPDNTLVQELNRLYDAIKSDLNGLE